MAILVGLVLTLFCLAIVVYPLAARTKNRAVPRDRDISQDDIELESIRESIQTLRLDHDLGKITGEQYGQQLQGYRLAAAHALRRQAESAPGTKEADLEQEILEARAVLEDGHQEPPTGRPEPGDDLPGN